MKAERLRISEDVSCDCHDNPGAAERTISALEPFPKQLQRPEAGFEQESGKSFAHIVKEV